MNENTAVVVDRIKFYDNDIEIAKGSLRRWEGWTNEEIDLALEGTKYAQQKTAMTKETEQRESLDREAKIKRCMRVFGYERQNAIAQIERWS